MFVLRLFAGFALVASLLAWGLAPKVTRNAPLEVTPPDQQAISVIAAPKPQSPPQAPAQSNAVYDLVGYEIIVPEALRVSEANLYYPDADIVWRGDDFGERKEQVGKFFQYSGKATLAKSQGGNRSLPHWLSIGFI